ncbi:adenosylcobinamide-GDP ribazoletransferase [Leptolyngbya cf. ectocarpi LEGE 11479]|uniref:Adenosylcobinamide-GDP ribazoletransferase n=1 Tax=Leptolyngbya cf. ectocarpi LEGE 11479 TaxID=1828722 RepID=A0A928ZWJ8_LEPEC|nr:adenosylcobinamide-GDP ribazoletransferase [Leptolyngbya ectocarpi]MBE9068759.1 adenosylcobinamide-GDP ribazoletransferase [Leptolyngbya cf. ectocarpi LEGE 11479]
MGRWIERIVRIGYGQWAVLNGAVLFYTRLPLPSRWPVAFDRVAGVVPIIGLGLGGLLAGLDLLLGLAMPSLLRSACVVLVGVWLTGGLHLDGAMDTADGLAVQDDQRRLAVMTDSRTGAFGAIVAIAILLLKTAALAAILHGRWFALVAAAAWGRWGQQWAIGSYPYLKPDGKGAFHKQALPSRWQALPWAVGLLGLTALTTPWISWQQAVAAAGVGIACSWLLASWLNRRLGGHTGDTYGAVVEWVEVAVLMGLASIG